MYSLWYDVGDHEWEIGSTQDLFIHRTKQHRKMQTYFYAPIGFRTPDLPVEDLVLGQRRHYGQQILLSCALTKHSYCIVV